MMSRRRRRLDRQRRVNVAKLARKISTQEIEQEKERAAKKVFREKEDAVRVKRLGPEKFVVPEIEVALSDEIPTSMRHLKSRDTLLKDRFTSIQRRNIIEPRSLKNYHRRFPLKVKEKRLYREYSLEQEKKYRDL